MRDDIICFHCELKIYVKKIFNTHLYLEFYINVSIEIIIMMMMIIIIIICGVIMLTAIICINVELSFERYDVISNNCMLRLSIFSICMLGFRTTFILEDNDIKILF